jgi:hypothetical protein
VCICTGCAKAGTPPTHEVTAEQIAYRQAHGPFTSAPAPQADADEETWLAWFRQKFADDDRLVALLRNLHDPEKWAPQMPPGSRAIPVIVPDDEDVLPSTLYCDVRPYFGFKHLNDSEKKGVCFLGVRPDEWKEEWGEPSNYVVMQRSKTLINIIEAPFFGSLEPILVFMSHNMGRVEGYVGIPKEEAEGHPGKVNSGQYLSPKEVLCEIAAWERLAYSLHAIICDVMHPKGYGVPQYRESLEKMNPWNERNRKIIRDALKKSGEWRERGVEP